jgi:hypothetical protein
MAETVQFAPQPLLSLPEPPKAPEQPRGNAKGQIPQSARQTYEQALRQYTADRAVYERRLGEVRDQNLRIQQANREGAERAERTATAERQAAERKAEADRAQESRERTYQIAISAGSAVAGMAIGHAGAHVIKASHAKHVAETAKPARDLARQATPLLTNITKRGPSPLAIDKLAALVKTADRMKIGRIAGPVGVATAGLLLAEGAFSRFVLAPQIENKTGQEAARAVGTASLFAATSIVGARMLQNAMPKSLPAAAPVATIETARNVVNRAAPGAIPLSAAQKLAASAGSLLKLASRAAPAVTLAVAATAAVASLMPSNAVAKPTPAPNPTTEGGSSADLARQAAARTAADMSVQQTVTAAAAQPAPIASDGRVDPYRRVQNGQVINVSGYQRVP